MAFEYYDPLGFWGGQPQQQQQQPLTMPGQPAVPTLNPQEEDSLLSSVTGKALGGLGYVGSSLGKAFGGRAIRGGLGGNARELLSVIPFSDTIGITNPEQEVHGEDLLKQWGLLEGDGTKGQFEARDLAGPGLEALLDPGTYLTFGGAALNGAGKAAKKAGTLEKTLAGRIGAGQGGLAGLHVPFTDIGTTLGTGPTAQAVAEKLGSWYDKALYSKPGVALSGLFDANTSLGGKTAQTAEVQRGVRAINEALPEARAQAVSPVLDDAMKLRDAGELNGSNSDIVNYLENTMHGPLRPAEGEAAANLQQAFAKQHQESLGLGMNEGTVQGYFPRQLTEMPGERGMAGRSGKVVDPTNVHQIGREDIFDLPGKRGFVNELSVDPNISGPERLIKSPSGLAEQAYVRKKVPGWNESELGDLRSWKKAAEQPGGPVFGPVEGNRALQEGEDLLRQGRVDRLTELSDIESRTAGLADWLTKLSPAHAKEQIEAFGNHAMVDAYNRTARHAESMTKTKGLLQIIGDVAKPAAGEGSVPVTEVLEKLGLTPQARVSLAGMMGKNPEHVLGLHLDGKVAEDLLRLKTGFTEPDALKPVLGAIDSFQSLFKMGQTAVWPARYVRNFVQEAWGSFVGGHSDPRFAGPQAYLQPMLDAVTVLRHGGTIEGAAAIPYFAGRSLTDEAASRELAKLAFAYRVAGPEKLVRDADVIGQGMHAAQRNLQLPGDVQPSLRQIAGSAVPKSIEEAMPTSVAGFGGRTETKFSGAVAGKELDRLIDDATRGGSFIALMRQGYTPQAAAAEVLKTHYDYANLSPAEKSIMRRVFPFYNWCVPDDSEILTRDGWKTCDSLIVGEEVLTYSLDKDCMEWQPCLQKNIFQHEGPLMEVKNKRHTLHFTANHRWPVQIREQTTKRPYGTYHYPARRAVVTGEELTGNHNLIVAAEFFGTESILTPEQARLLGWLVTDGSCRNRRGKYVEAIIYQHPGKFLEEVIAVAGGKPRKPHPTSGTVCVPVLKERKEAILPYLNKDNLIKVVTRLSRPAVEAMYDAMYKGDGCTKPHREYDFFAAQHVGVREAFRVLALLLGKRTSACDKGASVSQRRVLGIHMCQRGTVDYQGRVWCPTTDNGTWVMRQKGFITITGNSRQNLPAVLRQLVEEPSGPTAMLTKANAAVQRDGGFTPDYIKEGLAIPLGNEADGQRRYLSHSGLPLEDLALLGTGPNALQRTLQNVGSQLSPILKAPTEVMTGKQLHSGRDLADLYGSTGNTVLDQAVFNSPASRAVTSLRTLADDRKGLGGKALNLLTGARITDVDQDKARSVAARDYIEQTLKGAPGVRQFQTLSVPPDQLGGLSQDQFQMLRLLRTLEKDAKTKKPANIGVAP